MQVIIEPIIILVEYTVLGVLRIVWTMEMIYCTNNAICTELSSPKIVAAKLIVESGNFNLVREILVNT